MGRDFSHVRIHTGAAAGASARLLRAKAFAYGANIVFAHGVFQPGTSDGRRVLAHELAHVVQQEGGPPLIQRLDDDTLEAAETLDPTLAFRPEPPAAPEPDAAPFPGGWAADDFLSSDGRELWDALEIAWIWVVSEPSYATAVLDWIGSSRIPNLRADAESGAGAFDLPGALSSLSAAVENAIRAMGETIGTGEDAWLLLEEAFGSAADRLNDVDDRLPEGLSERAEAVAEADPLMGVYMHQFPSAERPPFLDFNMKTRLAFALSERTLPEAVAEGAIEAVRNPFFVPMVVIPIGVYVALWVAPDFTLTKVAAATLTAFLLTMFAWNDILTFAWEWAKFNSACNSATTEEDLREAGTQFTAKVGQVGFDILFMCMFWGLGKAAGPKLSAKATELQLARGAGSEGTQLPAPARPPPSEGPFRRVQVEGGTLFVDAEGVTHARVGESGRVEYVSRALVDAIIAFERGRRGAAPPGPGTPETTPTPGSTGGAEAPLVPSPGQYDLVVHDSLIAPESRQVPFLLPEGTPAAAESPSSSGVPNGELAPPAPMSETLRSGIVSQGPPTNVVGEILEGGEQIVRKTVAEQTIIGRTRFGKMWGAESIRAQEAALRKLEAAGIDTARIRQSFSDTGELILDYAGKSVEEQWPQMDADARAAFHEFVAQAKQVMGIVHDLKQRNIAYQRHEVDGEVIHRFIIFDPAFDRYSMVVAMIGGVGLSMIGTFTIIQIVKALRDEGD